MNKRRVYHLTKFVNAGCPVDLRFSLSRKEKKREEDLRFTLSRKEKNREEESMPFGCD